MTFKKTNLLLLLLLIASNLHLGNSIKTVTSFQELGEHHCQQFPIELLWRIATGSISEKYGEKYFDFDCYVRQFVRRDGLVIDDELEEEQEEESEEQESGDEDTGKKLEVDPLVLEYAQGLKGCLPEGIDSVEASYAIWRFFRFLVQHDYVYEWMRAKIRATLGYEAQRPNSWMDGQNSAARLRLDKLFSNQFYQYVDSLMFKDFLFPLLTFFKQNTVIALTGKVTKSGKPLLLQSLQTNNLLRKAFQPVLLSLPSMPTKIFTYTIPGIPLLFAGSTSKIAWSFTGVLVDRSNIEEIETVGNKFYHHDTEEWLKLDSQSIVIPGTGERECKFMHSGYGPLYTKQDRDGKNQEYIVRWHEKQAGVRTIFSGVYKLIINEGSLPASESLEFPFNSIVLVNETGIFQYICQQFYPSYFLYPDMFGEPEKVTQRWFSYPSRKIVVVSNSRLTPTKQDAYEKSEPLTPFDEQVLANFKAQKQTAFTPESLLKFYNSVTTTPHIKKLKQSMMRVYRKVKFLYLPQDQTRKKCDQLLSILEKWNNNLDEKKIAPIFILWNYFLQQYTFNYVSATLLGSHIVKHRLLTDNYWVNQMILWEKGTSYGECDSPEYEEMKHEVNGTGHNSSCYLNIIRAFNQTKDILSQRYGGDFGKINLDDFVGKKIRGNAEGHFSGDHLEEAFGVFYSKNVHFVAGVTDPEVIYYESYLEEEKRINLDQVEGKKSESNKKDEGYIDTDL